MLKIQIKFFFVMYENSLVYEEKEKKAALHQNYEINDDTVDRSAILKVGLSRECEKKFITDYKLDKWWWWDGV